MHVSDMARPQCIAVLLEQVCDKYSRKLQLLRHVGKWPFNFQLIVWLKHAKSHWITW